MTDKRNFEDLSPEAQRLVVDLAIGLGMPRFGYDALGPYPIKEEGGVWVDLPLTHERCGYYAAWEESRGCWSCTKCGKIEESELKRG